MKKVNEQRTVGWLGNVAWAGRSRGSETAQDGGQWGGFNGWKHRKCGSQTIGRYSQLSQINHHLNNLINHCPLLTSNPELEKVSQKMKLYLLVLSRCAARDGMFKIITEKEYVNNLSATSLKVVLPLQNYTT